MPSTDVLFEILTDMNGKVGSLQHSAQHADIQRQIIFDRIEKLGKVQQDTAMQVDRISVVIEDLKTMRETVAWVRRFRSYVMWVLGVMGAAVTTVVLSFLDSLKGLFRAVN